MLWNLRGGSSVWCMLAWWRCYFFSHFSVSFVKHNNPIFRESHYRFAWSVLFHRPVLERLVRQHGDDGACGSCYVGILNYRKNIPETALHRPHSGSASQIHKQWLESYGIEWTSRNENRFKSKRRQIFVCFQYVNDFLLLQ